MHESVHYLAAGGEAQVEYSRGKGVCALSCGDGFVSELPTHPKARGRFSPILTHEAAGHVLTTIEPPFSEAEADIYVARGFSAGGDRPVVMAVWFRVDVAKPRTDLRRVFARLRGRVAAESLPMPTTLTGRRGLWPALCTWDREWVCWQGGGGTA